MESATLAALAEADLRQGRQYSLSICFKPAQAALKSSASLACLPVSMPR
jgi:hypothetical protein